MTALLRYLAADALRAERWVAPTALYLVVAVAGTAGGGSALSCYGLTALALFPVALWLSVTVSNSEDPAQTAITAVTVGRPLLVRLAKLLVAYLVSLALAGLAVLWPVLTGHPFAAADVVAGIVAHLLTALVGVAAGSLLARPLLRTPAWAVLAGIALVLAEFLIPGLPAARPVAASFSGPAVSAADLTRSLSLLSGESLLLAASLIALSHLLARRRV